MLTARERKVLVALLDSEWEYKGSLYAGDITLSALIGKEWVEQLQPVPSGLVRFRITGAGKRALREFPERKGARSKPKLKALTPRLKELPPRIKSLR